MHAVYFKIATWLPIMLYNNWNYRCFRGSALTLTLFTLFTPVVEIPKQVTFAIIKPDAVKAGLVDEIIQKVIITMFC